VNARNTTPGNLHRSQPIYGRVGFQGQLNNPNSDTPPAIGTGPAAPFGPTPSFGRGGLPGSRGISLSAYPTLPALPIRTVPAVPSEKQPADDAIGQIQSESSLFLTGGMIARSMPPRVGSAAQRVSIPLRAAPQEVLVLDVHQAYPLLHPQVTQCQGPQPSDDFQCICE
jgi:hypothetical protein